MEQSPLWEARSFSASQIPHILWNLEVQYCIYKSLWHLSISWARLFQYMPFHFIFLRSIMLPSTPGSSKWSFSFRFSYQNPVCSSLPAIYAVFPAHLIILTFDHLNNTGWRVQIMKLLSIQFCPFSCYFRPPKGDSMSQIILDILLYGCMCTALLPQYAFSVLYFSFYCLAAPSLPLFLFSIRLL